MQQQQRRASCWWLMEQRRASPGRTCLLALLLLTCWASRGTFGQVLGDVYLYSSDNITLDDPFPTLPADFGPDVPEEGLDGYLRLADPLDACRPFSFSITNETWVALISRAQQPHPTNCTFDVKVRNAEAAGASAAIVYDDVFEALLIMSKPAGHPDPCIPAVFVSEKAGLIMSKLLTPGQTRVRIVPVSSSAFISLVMSAFLGLLALTVVMATFYVMRTWSVWLGAARGRRGGLPTELGFGGYGQGAGQEGLPACVIRALPVLVYEGKISRRRSSKAADATQQQQQQQQAAAAAAATGEAARSSEAPAGAGAAALFFPEAASEQGGGEQHASPPRPRGPTAAALAAIAAAAAAAAPCAPASPAPSDASSPLMSTDDDDPAPVGLRGGATRRSCCVCLERYVTGDQLRVLPCQHRFHRACIDPWLASRRLCPVCKNDASIVPPPQLQRALSGSAGAAAAAAGDGDDGAEAAATSGVSFVGHRRWLRRLRARLLREPGGGDGAQTAPHAAAAAAAAGPGPLLPPPAALYAAAAAAADAAEAGLLPLSAGRPAPAGLQPPLRRPQHQHQWQHRQRQQQSLERRLLRHHLPDLAAPLLSASGSSQQQQQQQQQHGGVPIPAASSAAVATAVLHGGGVRLLPASPPLPIPALTPIHSDASSVGSLTPRSTSFRSVG